MEAASGETASFGVELRYQSSQTIYAIPSDGWEKFKDCERQGDLPKIAYVPPFSGLSHRRNGWMLPQSVSRREKASLGACCVICCCGCVLRLRVELMGA